MHDKICGICGKADAKKYAVYFDVPGEVKVGFSMGPRFQQYVDLHSACVARFQAVHKHVEEIQLDWSEKQ